MVGAASGAAGGLVPGSGGAAASASISAMAAMQTAIRARMFSGAFGAGTAALTYEMHDVARNILCESKCGAQ